MPRPTRTDLVAAITSLQGLIGLAQAATNDRNPNRAAEVRDYLEQAHALCVEARTHDPPTAGKRSRFANQEFKSTAS